MPHHDIALDLTLAQKARELLIELQCQTPLENQLERYDVLLYLHNLITDEGCRLMKRFEQG